MVFSATAIIQIADRDQSIQYSHLHISQHPETVPALTDSKSSSISFEGGAVIKDTTMMQTEEKINAGSNS